MNKPKSDDDWLLEHRNFIECESTNPILTILDLGCGRGRDTHHLVQFGQVIAADLDLGGLKQCTMSVPTCYPVRLDITAPLPFSDNTFDFVLASLSLHYFSWRDTEKVMQELIRCLSPQGRGIIRLNSTKDLNYGANSTSVISNNYFNVGKKKKRFFDEQDVLRLVKDLHVENVRELEIDRYNHTKVVWEILLYAREEFL